MASKFPILVHLLFYFIALPCFAIAQTSGNVSVGNSLTAGNGDSWLSPTREFAFGFYQPDNNEDFFLLSIWYVDVSDNSIVWYYRDTNNPLVPRGSTVQLTVEGLVLNNPQDQLVWRRPVSRASTVAYGVMNDTGNFMLVNSDSRTVWQSFDDPADTLLPGQVMERGDTLSSRKSETNFSSGRFQFRLLEDGAAVLNPSNYPDEQYYASDTRDAANTSNSGYQVMFDESGHFYILKRNGDRFNLTSESAVPASDYYLKATLNFDGVFTISHRLKNPSRNESWTDNTIIPTNICVDIRGKVGAGACGFNSVCRLSNRRPRCECPEGYSLIDPNDRYGSCKPDFVQGCDGGESIMMRLPNTDWPESDYEYVRSYNEEDCRRSCLEDCLCAASIYRTDECWKKKLPLSNGREDTDEISIAFLKIGNHTNSNNPSFPVPVPPQNTKKDQDGLIIVLSVLVGSVSVIFVGLLFFCYYCNRYTENHQTKSSMESNLQNFTYKELQEATGRFNEELGRGSFGVVYKGMIETSSGAPTAIAVKKLDRVLKDADEEFKTEVKVIGRTHHKNLVRLLGYCNEGEHRLLVYEFLSNGTLASFLFEDLTPSWHQRTQIALGIGQGLLYLHEECSTQIIHCDIKPQNILLDNSYNPRISDFGLAKLLMLNQTQTKTNIRGTKGYVAPEWFRSMPVTVKVDVYSFGVILLEIISCRRSVDLEMDEDARAILTDWAYDCFREGRFDALVDDDPEALSDINRLKRFVMVAIWCIQEDPSLRPTMKKAMLMLEGIIQVTVPPSPCPFNSIKADMNTSSLV